MKRSIGLALLVSIEILLRVAIDKGEILFSKFIAPISRSPQVLL
jgi:hypothetical protein